MLIVQPRAAPLRPSSARRVKATEGSLRGPRLGGGPSSRQRGRHIPCKWPQQQLAHGPWLLLVVVLRLLLLVLQLRLQVPAAARRAGQRARAGQARAYRLHAGGSHTGAKAGRVDGRAGRRGPAWPGERHQTRQQRERPGPRGTVTCMRRPRCSHAGCMYTMQKAVQERSRAGPTPTQSGAYRVHHGQEQRRKQASYTVNEQAWRLLPARASARHDPPQERRAPVKMGVMGCWGAARRARLEAAPPGPPRLWSCTMLIITISRASEPCMPAKPQAALVNGMKVHAKRQKHLAAWCSHAGMTPAVLQLCSAVTYRCRAWASMGCTRLP